MSLVGWVDVGYFVGEWVNSIPRVDGRNFRIHSSTIPREPHDQPTGGRLPGAVNVPSEEWGDDERIDALVQDLRARCFGSSYAIVYVCYEYDSAALVE